MSAAATGGAVVANAQAPEDGHRSETRFERETTPAPMHIDVAGCTPSHRPTSKPEFDVDAFALGALEGDACNALSRSHSHRLPNDLAIPTRTPLAPPQDLALRLAFVLLHVDGRTSVRDIANSVALPIAEASEAFRELVSKGLVDMGSGEGPPSSGRFSR